MHPVLPNLYKNHGFGEKLPSSLKFLYHHIEDSAYYILAKIRKLKYFLQRSIGNLTFYDSGLDGPLCPGHSKTPALGNELFCLKLTFSLGRQGFKLSKFRAFHQYISFVITVNYESKFLRYIKNFTILSKMLKMYIIKKPFKFQTKNLLTAY